MFIRKNLKGVAKSAAREQGRYAINGVHVKRLDEHSIRVAATDGRQLLCVVAQETADMDAKKVPDFQAILSVEAFTKTLTDIKPLKNAKREDFNGCFLQEEGVNGHAVATVKDGTRNIPTVDGIFPNIQQVIPNYDIQQPPDIKSVKHGRDAVKISVDPRLLIVLLQGMIEATDTNPGERMTVEMQIPTSGAHPVCLKMFSDTVIEEEGPRKGIPIAAATGVLMPVNPKTVVEQAKKYKTAVAKPVATEDKLTSPPNPGFPTQVGKEPAPAVEAPAPTVAPAEVACPVCAGA